MGSDKLVWARRSRALLLAVVLLFAGKADASIVVSVIPDDQVVFPPGGSFAVDLVADIPEEEAIVTWGIDLSFSVPGIVGAVQNVVVGPDFLPVSSADGDDIAGLVFFLDPPVFGTDVLLATLTLSIDSIGETDLLLSDDNPSDLTEGFALNPPPAGAFADVTYVPGHVTVIPEPAAVVALLTLQAVLILRRRHR